MGCAGHITNVMVVTSSYAASTPIIIGGAPPDQGFNDMLLNHTVRRDLPTNSFFRDVGGSRFDQESLDRLQAELAEVSAEILAGLNVPLFLDLRHWCWGGFGANRCCLSDAAAVIKVRRSMDAVIHHAFVSPARARQE